MRKILKTPKNYFLFVSMIVAQFMAFGSVAFNFNGEQESNNQAVEAEKLKVVMFYTQKNDLEKCMNESSDQEIKIESFELLLQHITYQDVPVTTMNNMIQKCRATLNS